jgi:SAM-dependent methyltransferase
MYVYSHSSPPADGVLNAQFARTLSSGRGHVHGIDSSPAMIAACDALNLPARTATFSVVDVSAPPYDAAALFSPFSPYDKIFSNAALHWILTPHNTRAVLAALRAVLAPGGTFAFEMGGFGNVREIRTALRCAVAARVGLAAAVAADPWFFPDEAFMRAALEGAGWEVVRMELVERPTHATDAGGVSAWVRLFGSPFLDVVPGGDDEREAVAREVTEVLEGVCAEPGGTGYVLGYTRLRCLARRVEGGKEVHVGGQ